MLGKTERSLNIQLSSAICNPFGLCGYWGRKLPSRERVPELRSPYLCDRAVSQESKGKIKRQHRKEAKVLESHNEGRIEIG